MLKRVLLLRESRGDFHRCRKIRLEASIAERGESQQQRRSPNPRVHDSCTGKCRVRQIRASLSLQHHTTICLINEHCRTAFIFSGGDVTPGVSCSITHRPWVHRYSRDVESSFLSSIPSMPLVQRDVYRARKSISLEKLPGVEPSEQLLLVGIILMT